MPSRHAEIENIARDLTLQLRPELDALDERDQREIVTYWHYHGRRYAALIDVVRAQLFAQDCSKARLLDVGPNLQTGLLREALPGVAVDTLGFNHPFFVPRDGERHIELDLNEIDVEGAPQGDGRHDAIVMAEVIEHLHTSPVLVLGYLAGWLRAGGVLVVQTPNAVALHKRLRMLAGKSPWEPIRISRKKSGHFHEYTAAELEEAAREAGLSPEGWLSANYFGGSSRFGKAYGALGPVLPKSLRHGITMWMRRP